MKRGPCSAASFAVGPTEDDVRFPLTGPAHIAMIRGDYEAALDFATRSYVVNRHFYATFWMLIAANAQLGRLEAAREFLAQLLTISPGVTISGIKARQYARYPDRMANILAGLRMAGMPEN